MRNMDIAMIYIMVVPKIVIDSGQSKNALERSTEIRNSQTLKEEDASR